MEADSLILGSTYYRVTFADRDFTMPCVEPCVFIGAVQDESGAESFAFQDTVSFVTSGSALEEDLTAENCAVFLAAAEEIPGGVHDLVAVAKIVSDAAERAKGLAYPNLQVLKDA